MKSLVKGYVKELMGLLERLDEQQVESAVNRIEAAYRDKKCIFVLGNGGSAATAAHFAADFGKNAVKSDENRPKVISLCDNVPYITAYGNDMGYENIFAEQLKNLLTEGDLVIAISASGNSPNVIKAAEYAKSKGTGIIALTGFDGGKLKEYADIHINVASSGYEPVEDIHLVTAHIIVYCFKRIYG